MRGRIGVLTGGGDAPGLNAVIRAVVRTATVTYDMEVIGIEDGYEGLLVDPPRTRPLTLDAVRGILPLGGTVLGTSNRTDATAHASRWDPTEPGIPNSYDVAVAAIRALGLKALITIGGDGTLTMANRMAGMGAPIIGVPKTIDNDVAATDATFGFDTAVSIVTEAIDRLHTTAEAHQRVMIVEVMGRHAGWIALHAGVAGGADVILIPEIPFTLPAVIDTIEQRYASGRRFTMIVAAEGAHPVDGEAIYQGPPNPYGMRRLGGIGAWLEAEIFKLCPRELRVTVLGHLQRGGGPTAADRLLATRYGCMAAALAHRGQTGVMVALQQHEIVAVPLSEACQAPREVDPAGQLVQLARGLGVCFG